MTRFARSKGSKASNERIPEPATPWHEMKAQLLNKYKEQEDSERRVEVDERRSKTYENFLRQKQEEEAKEVKWAEFPGIQKKTKQKLKEKRKIKEVIKKGLVENKKQTGKDTNNIKNKFQTNGNDDNYYDDDDDDSDEEFQSLKRKLEEKLRKELNKKSNSSDEEAPEEVSAKIEPQQPIIKKQKAKKEKLTISVNSNAKETPEEIAKRRAEKKLERRKLQKLKQKQTREKPTEDLTEEEHGILEKHRQKILAKREKRRQLRQKRKAERNENLSEGKEMTDEEKAKVEKHKQKVLARKQKLREKKEKKMLEKKIENEQTQKKKKKPLEEMTEEERAKVEKHRQKKLAQKQKRDKYRQEKKDSEDAKRNGESYSRRKPLNLENFKINGQEIQLARYNGFPVMKDDYDRLIKLEKEMRIKGVPRDEINRAMKLEQRRAEKALARLKKKVCFHCRLSGHNLSECPLLSGPNEHESMNSGICFKCGSTEHTHFNCKVVRTDEYKFATCFICKEQGHISRQCPDNNRGLYPKGGACRVCGDVTHLKKDCPKYQMQQEKAAVVVETINSKDVETLEGEEVKSDNSKKATMKVVKF